MTTRQGDRLTLPVPVRSWRDPASFDRDLDQIIGWWHAHGSGRRTYPAGSGYPWAVVPTASADPWAPPPPRAR